MEQTELNNSPETRTIPAYIQNALDRRDRRNSLDLQKAEREEKKEKTGRLRELEKKELPGIWNDIVKHAKSMGVELDTIMPKIIQRKSFPEHFLSIRVQETLEANFARIESAAKNDYSNLFHDVIHRDHKKEIRETKGTGEYQDTINSLADKYRQKFRDFTNSEKYQNLKKDFIEAHKELTGLRKSNRNR